MEEKFISLREVISEYAPKLVLAIVTLVVGWIVIGWIIKILGRSLKKTKMDASVNNYIKSLISILLKTLLLFSVASTFGIVTTSFVAILGAAAFAIGMALQGSLSHFAAGVLIMIFKPYRIGDFVEVGSKSGTVKEIGIFTTQLTTTNNNLVFVPNSQVLNDPITNYTTLGVRRLVLEFGIGYDDDIDEARSIIENLLTGHELVLVERGVDVFVASHGDSSVNLTVRAWATSGDFWTVHFYMMEQVKKEFDKAGIGIPYPQMDVHFPNQSPVVSPVKD